MRLPGLSEPAPSPPVVNTDMQVITGQQPLQDPAHHKYIINREASQFPEGAVALPKPPPGSSPAPVPTIGPLAPTKNHKKGWAPHLKWDPLGVNITRYNLNWLFTWAFLQIWTGTVFNARIIVQVLLSCGIATIFGYFRCDPAKSDWTKFDKSGPTVAQADWQICIPLANGEALLLSSVVAFLIGMFVSLVFSRWWQNRQLLQGIIGRTGNFTLQVATYIVGDDDATRRARYNIIRYANLAHVLVYKQAGLEADLNPDQLDAHYDLSSMPARPDPARLLGCAPDCLALPSLASDAGDGPQDLVNGQLQLMSPEEWKILKPLPNKWQMVYSWVACLVRDCAATGRMVFPSTMLPNFQIDLTTMRGSAGDIFMVLHTQVPYAYVHLLTIIVKMHLVFITLYASTVLGVGFQQKQGERIIMGYLILFFNMLIYEGLLSIADELDNPFGGDYGDFPKGNYIKNLLAVTKSQLDIIGKPPPAVTELQRSPPPAVPSLLDEACKLAPTQEVRASGAAAPPPAPLLAASSAGLPPGAGNLYASPVMYESSGALFPAVPGDLYSGPSPKEGGPAVNGVRSPSRTLAI
eukprot:tig00021281_g19931.t1